MGTTTGVARGVDGSNQSAGLLKSLFELSLLSGYRFETAQFHFALVTLRGFLPPGIQYIPFSGWVEKLFIEKT